MGGDVVGPDVADGLVAAEVVESERGVSQRRRPGLGSESGCVVVSCHQQGGEEGGLPGAVQAEEESGVRKGGREVAKERREEGGEDGGEKVADAGQEGGHLETTRERGGRGEEKGRTEDERLMF